jgi:transcriptional regulator with XRE-family HTH domain
MSRNAFGPNLRRIRLQRGVTLEQIANTTKVPRELFDDLERNDFSRWPTGIYARAYVRQYAYAVGVDPDSTVDEFCRSFDQGDRRAERIVREQSVILGHSLEWQDNVRSDADRRGGATPRRGGRTDFAPSPLADEDPPLRFLARLKRVLGRA